MERCPPAGKVDMAALMRLYQQQRECMESVNSFESVAQLKQRLISLWQVWTVYTTTYLKTYFFSTTPHSYTDGDVNHATQQPAPREAVAVGCLAQGHLDTRLGRVGDGTSNLPVATQPFRNSVFVGEWVLLFRQVSSLM